MMPHIKPPTFAGSFYGGALGSLLVLLLGAALAAIGIYFGLVSI